MSDVSYIDREPGMNLYNTTNVEIICSEMKPTVGKQSTTSLEVTKHAQMRMGIQKTSPEISNASKMPKRD